MNEEERKLRAERGKLVKDIRQVIDTAEKEKRALTGDENIKLNQMEERLKEVQTSIKREAMLAEIEADERSTIGTPIPENTEPPEGRTSRVNELRTAMNTMLNAFDRAGSREIARSAAIESIGRERFDAVQRDIFRRYMLDGTRAINAQEARALQLDSDVSGGYLVAPEQMVADLIKALDANLFVRRLATKFTVTSAKSLGAVSLDTDPADASWTGEISTVGEDSSTAFGKRNLYPHPLAKLIKISRDLLRASGNIEQLVRERMIYKLAYPQENGFLNGSGSNSPLGVMTASDLGIGTSRDVSTGNAATSIQFNGLMAAKMKLKAGYRTKASTRWAFHTDGILQIMLLKNGNGDYIWKESVRVGEPDRILGLPYEESELMPNTFTTGQYVGILGDWSYYWIADAIDMEIQRLEELYAATNQVGLISRAKCDGMPVLAEAFVRVKLG